MHINGRMEKLRPQQFQQIYDKELCVVTMYYVCKNKYAAMYFWIYSVYDRYVNVTRQFV